MATPRPLTTLLAAALLLFGSPANLAYATDYFVSGSGSDAADGLSSATAFRTITRAMATAGSGDRILVESGTFNAGAGEAFPIDLADGVEVRGPGDGSAVVNASNSGGAVFRVGALVEPTVLDGLTIQSDNSGGVGVLCTGLPAELTISNNEFSGRNGIHNIPNNNIIPGGATVLTVDNNTIDCTVLGIAWGFRSVSAAHSLTITNNSLNSGVRPVLLTGTATATSGTLALRATLQANLITPTSATDDAVLIRAMGPTDIHLDLTLTENTIQSAAQGLSVFAFGSAVGGQVQVNGVVENNTLTACHSGVFVEAYGVATSASAHLGVDVRRNLVDQGVRGILMQAGVLGANGTMTAACSVECNTVQSNSELGMFARFVGLGPNTLVNVAPLFLDNRFIDNERGVDLILGAAGGVTATFAPAFRGNTVTGSTDDGVFLSLSTSGPPVLNYAPDFGGAVPGTLGLNTIAGNNTSSSPAAFDFNAAGVDAAWTIPAEGNWWGASSTSGIAPLIQDQADNAGFAAVDFSAFLTEPLTFAVSPLVPDEPATATATGTTGFVAKSGADSLDMHLDGNPIPDPVVSADGRVIHFTVPTVLVGNYTLTIINASGQEGTLPVAVVVTPGPVAGGGGGGGGGGCFVATAAFGDHEAAEVRVLRAWRDEELMDGALGRGLVRAYYQLSPGLAEAVADNAVMRAVSRAALAPVVGAARLWMEQSWVFWLIAAILACCLRRRAR